MLQINWYTFFKSVKNPLVEEGPAARQKVPVARRKVPAARKKVPAARKKVPAARTRNNIFLKWGLSG